MKERRSTVVLCDHHAMLSTSLQARLESRGFHVLAFVPHAAAAVAVCQLKQPDLLLIGIVMPGTDPFDAVTRIGEMSPQTRVLFLSGFASDSFLDRVVGCGAAGFVSKSETFESLLLAMRHVLAGFTYFSPEAAGRLLQTGGAPPKSRLSTLSPREREMLRYLAQDLDPRQISELTGVTARQIQRYDRSLRRKLALRGAAGLARFAMHEGLLG